jgi:hypothetical protein
MRYNFVSNVTKFVSDLAKFVSDLRQVGSFRVNSTN